MGVLKKYIVTTKRVVTETHQVYARGENHAKRLSLSDSPLVMFSSSDTSDLELISCQEVGYSEDQKNEDQKHFQRKSELLEVLLDSYLHKSDAFSFLNEDTLKKHGILILREYFVTHYARSWEISSVIEKIILEKGLSLQSCEDLYTVLEEMPDSFYINYIQGKNIETIERELFAH